MVFKCEIVYNSIWSWSRNESQVRPKKNPVFRATWPFLSELAEARLFFENMGFFPCGLFNWGFNSLKKTEPTLPRVFKTVALNTIKKFLASGNIWSYTQHGLCVMVSASTCKLELITSPVLKLSVHGPAGIFVLTECIVSLWFCNIGHDYVMVKWSLCLIKVFIVTCMYKLLPCVL